MGFSCGTLVDHGNPTVVWATGEVDSRVAARLGAEIEQHLAPGSAVALDCAGITFMDSLGMQVLTHASRAADQSKAAFMLVTVPLPLRRILELAGLTSAIDVYDTITQAELNVARR